MAQHWGAWTYPVLFLAGIAVAFINSVSGGGSTLSLPLLIFLGLPAATANGTNRLGILLGSLSSLLAFRSQGIFLPRLALRVGGPAMAGALAGSLIAVRLPDRVFNPILACVVLFVAAMTFRGHGAQADGGQEPALRGDALALLAYLGIGFYGGFIQAGSGLIMIFAFTRLGNLDIFRANALKVFNTVLFISVSLAAFAAAGRIDWPMAAALAAGNLLGGWLGSVTQLRRGEKWVNRFVLWSGVGVAAKLLWDSWSAWTR
ncbi:MAG: sulfite exporter TauE/SafE family protein [Fibrobacteres bacterium]|nr:sulfite exporter TauE/SafE family protein [Fibrobacterota bacterium]